MFFLLIACAPPESDPGLILMGPDALDAGAALEIEGQDFSSALPVLGYADEEIWVGLPDGEELRLEPQSGELLQVWLDGDALFYEVGVLGEEIDPDAVLVVGSGSLRLSEELGIEGEEDQDGIWLRAPELLMLLTDSDLPQVEAIVPLEASGQSPGLMLETANLASPSPSIREGRRSQGVFGGGGFGAAAGSADPSTSAEAGTVSGLSGLDSLEPIRGEAMSSESLALVGYYEDQDGTQYTLSMDGSLSMQAQEGKSLQGFYTVDGAGMVHFYVGMEGPVASFQVDRQGSLYTRGQELTRLEFACIW
jgi:hypothetical protein